MFLTRYPETEYVLVPVISLTADCLKLIHTQWASGISHNTVSYVNPQSQMAISCLVYPVLHTSWIHRQAFFDFILPNISSRIHSNVIIKDFLKYLQYNSYDITVEEV